MTTLHIRYEMRLADERSETFDLRLDAQTLLIEDRERPDPPPWTALEFHKCPNCPLEPATHPQCPLARSIAPIVNRFDDVISFDEVDVAVTTPERTISKHTTSQTALRSLLGLVMACSGCPHLAIFRPMARFHLPFATEEETTFRAVATWLVAQHFRHGDGKSATWDLDGLQAIYAEMQVVNRATCQRLRAATRTDASINAVALLDVYAFMVPHFIRAALEDIRAPFDAFLSRPENG